MIGTVGLVTDSNSQLPPALAERYGVEVVPLTVTVDGREHQEGVDLDADAFYAHFADGAAPTVTTTQPGPATVEVAYRRLVEQGATEILSIHIASAMSGTLNSARLAAAAVDVPVRLVDSGTASFGIACCVWEAAEALVAGRSVDEAARRAEALVAHIGNVFVVRALDLARRGGRLIAATPIDDGAGDVGDAIPVLSLIGGELQVVGTAAHLDAAAEVMAAYVVEAGAALGGAGASGGLRVAMGIADAEAEPVRLALEARLLELDVVTELVHYRIGPSVGVHTGPGAAGAFFFPA
ncbi:MAG: DegV family protein [Acidimicrobiia bacterium]|nr:DegV family protein [Acidimicrobiia bacterium]